MDAQKENRFFGFIAISLALFGVAAPYRWHEMSPLISDVALGFAAFFGVLALWHLLPAAMQALAKRVYLKRVIAALIIAGITTWAFHESHKTLPGMAVAAFVRLYDTPELRRRYIFEAQTNEGAKTAFYLSASGAFIFAVTDVHGKSYSLEMPVGNDGIPVDRYFFLYCDVGVSKADTLLRTLVDGKEIRERSLPFPIDLGNTQSWKQHTIGADNQGQNNAPFKIGLFAISHATLTDRQIQNFNDHFVEYLRAIDSPIVPRQ